VLERAYGWFSETECDGRVMRATRVSGEWERYETARQRRLDTQTERAKSFRDCLFVCQSLGKPIRVERRDWLHLGILRAARVVP
jgi:hypothetical protein